MGPYPIQLVVVIAVRHVVSAAMMIFSAISRIRFFIVHYGLGVRCILGGEVGEAHVGETIC